MTELLQDDDWPVRSDAWEPAAALRPIPIYWEPEPPRSWFRPLLLAVAVALAAFLVTIAAAAAAAG